MNIIGVFANCQKPSAAEVLGRFAETAARLGLRLAAEAQTARLLPGARCLTPEKLIRSVSLLMVFGGDGTMLRAIRMLQGRTIPVLGVNLGSLGFLTSVAQQDAGRALECVAAKKYTVGDRVLAECTVKRAGPPAALCATLPARRTLSSNVGGRTGRIIRRYRALNDVVIDHGACSRIVTLDMCIDDEAVSSFMCDGLIISTPTGSTGHSLSAGGPILYPGAAAFVISLICPHTLSTRPLVIPDEKRISVRVAKSAGEVLLSVDGQIGAPLKPGDMVEVRRSKASAHFVHLPDYSYFAVLRQKLHWRGSALA